jgi:16S rRNA (cytidine1402-2'-O)-methyltransferase
MALFVVATPIGNPQDHSLRALEILRSADLIIGEELKVLRQTLKGAGVQGRSLDQLNEHSRAADIEHFVEQCRDLNVALVSDCGTPGFCDPGAELVAACVQAGIAVRPVPGASSLMALLSVCGIRLERFLFYGFLPAKAADREAALRALKNEKQPFVLLETPYRCERLVQDIATHFPRHRCVLGMDLTSDNEEVLRVRGAELAGLPLKDREPIVLLVP